MIAKRYVPDRGDVVWLQFDPKAGRRPALVVSPKAYNDRVGLALFCPITSRIKGYPFEVQFPPDSKVEGAVLSDQLKSLDWRAREAKRFARAPSEVLGQVLAKIHVLVDDS